MVSLAGRVPTKWVGQAGGEREGPSVGCLRGRPRSQDKGWGRSHQRPNRHEHAAEESKPPALHAAHRRLHHSPNPLRVSVVSISHRGAAPGYPRSGSSVLPFRSRVSLRPANDCRGQTAPKQTTFRQPAADPAALALVGCTPDHPLPPLLRARRVGVPQSLPRGNAVRPPHTTGPAPVPDPPLLPPTILANSHPHCAIPSPYSQFTRL